MEFLCSAAEVFDALDDSNVFDGWQTILSKILSKFPQGLYIEEIMNALRLVCPNLYYQGPFGGKTVRNTCSNALTMGLRKKQFRVIAIHHKYGRVYVNYE
jgi:hypothetical protein